MKRLTLAVLALALALPTSYTPAEAAPAQTTVITLNVHGGMDRKGGGNGGDVAPITRDVTAIIAKYHPAVIGFQEICGKQYRDLRTKLAKLGYSGALTTIMRTSGCNDKAQGNRSGNAIFVKGRITWKASWALPWGKNAKGVTGRQPRRLLCVKTKALLYTACVTHLSPHEPDVMDQARKVNGIMGRWGSVVLAADLNLKPTWVGREFPRYSAAGTGIDHVVASGAASVLAVENAPSSDHDALVATVRGTT